MKKLLALWVALLCAAGCKTGPYFPPREAAGNFTPVTLTNRLTADSLQPSREPYRLGPGDTIDIEAVGEGAVGPTSVTLGPDGKIYYSLLPGLSVWGLTLSDTRGLLEKELAKYSRIVPTMLVNLRTVGSKRMWLLGAVASPGVYPLGTPTTLLEAIALAGGVPPGGSGADDGADFQKSFVLRNGHRLPVDFDRLLNHGDLGQNIYLQPDDFVFLAPANQASVYVLGAVGGQTVLPYTRDLTLARALLLCGGVVEYARQHSVVIVRGSLSEPRIAEVDYKHIVTGEARDVQLQPGDIVYVPFVPYKFAAELAEQLIDQFVRTIAVNEGTALGSGQNNPAQVVQPVGIITQ